MSVAFRESHDDNAARPENRALATFSGTIRENVTRRPDWDVVQGGGVGLGGNTFLQTNLLIP